MGGILSPEEARDLAAQLPSELAEAVTVTSDHPVLRKVVSDGEFTDVVMDLPGGFDELVVI